MYYRASSALARLAKGTANLKMFMNAGATAPEWAAGIKAIQTTRILDAANGDVGYTGFGFKPSAIIAFGIGYSGITFGMNAGNQYYCYTIYGSAPTYTIGGTANEILRFHDGTNTESGVLKSFDADGITITWTKTNGISDTGYITLIGFR